ncbi:hypothetical protein [Myxococcus xanthus]|nr:hypothetical protein [Myxococcus xanthus]
MEGLVVCGRRVTDAMAVVGVSNSELLEVLELVLFGEKEAWGAAVDGLITRTETARLLLANLESWLVERAKIPWGEEKAWDLELFVPEVEVCLFGVI